MSIFEFQQVLKSIKKLIKQGFLKLEKNSKNEFFVVATGLKVAEIEKDTYIYLQELGMEESEE